MKGMDRLGFKSPRPVRPFFHGFKVFFKLMADPTLGPWFAAGFVTGMAVFSTLLYGLLRQVQMLIGALHAG